MLKGKVIDNILSNENIEIINQISITHIESNYVLNYFLAKKDKMDYIYNTSALDGNPMTYPEVETLLSGITVGGYKISDERMILTQNSSVNLLFDLIKNNQFNLDKSTFLKLHNEVAKEELLCGKFRDRNVRIVGTKYVPPNFNNLDLIFSANYEQLQKINNPISRGITFFILSSRTKYFYNSNKIISRLMMNGELLSNGYPMLNLKAQDKFEFNKIILDYYNSDIISEPLQFLINYYKKQNEQFDS